MEILNTVKKSALGISFAILTSLSFNANAALLELQPLKYTQTPFVSAETLSYHHGKHLQNYINTTNSLIKGTKYENKTLEEIIKTSSGPLFNNAAQVWNHQFYFNCLSPKKVTMPANLKSLIEKNFKSVDNFIKLYSQAAAANFGSGWTWLVQTDKDKLEILNTSNAENPLVKGGTALLTIDIWEHAYYLDYQNRRADYIKDFMEYVDWNFVQSNLTK